MGISTNVDQLLENFQISYDPATKVKIYDDYIERQMASTTSVETHVFLMPIWRLRSSFHDALRPIQESAVDSLLGCKRMRLATKAIREGRIDDPSIYYVLQETEKCYRTYSSYIRRLKQLYNQTKYIFNTISHHKVDVLDDYAEFHNYNPIATRSHYNRIVFVLEMSIVMGESIRDAIHNAYRVMNCAQENLDMMLTCYQHIFTLKQLDDDARQKLNLSPSSNSATLTTPFPWLGDDNEDNSRFYLNNSSSFLNTSIMEIGNTLTFPFPHNETNSSSEETLDTTHQEEELNSASKSKLNKNKKPIDKSRAKTKEKVPEPRLVVFSNSKSKSKSKSSHKFSIPSTSTKSSIKATSSLRICNRNRNLNSTSTNTSTSTKRTLNSKSKDQIPTVSGSSTGTGTGTGTGTSSTRTRSKWPTKNTKVPTVVSKTLYIRKAK